MSELHATTVLLVRRAGRVALVGDGQVTLDRTILKQGARKVRRAGGGRVLIGFAGGAADGLALFDRFEAKLQAHAGQLERAVVELAQDWRTDRSMRQLQAQMIVADHEAAYLVSGNGDLLQPDGDDCLAIGSGGVYALAAAQALMRHTEMPAAEIARAAMTIAAEICIYTNDRFTLEELP